MTIDLFFDYFCKIALMVAISGIVISILIFGIGSAIYGVYSYFHKDEECDK